VEGCRHCRSFAGFEEFSKVDTLVLDKNNLASLSGLPRMDSVRTLSFNNNVVDDFPLFLDTVCASLPNVDILSAMRNPASPPMIQMSEEDVAASARHRLYVIYRLPKLRFLDAVAVTAAERAEATAKGRFLVPRRAAPSTVAPAAPPAEAEEPAEETAPASSKGMSAYLGIGKSSYDGKHSEGNRFIVNDDL
jgi:leucine-rich melanocyte differentiation-associated protein